jgi:hypothetical protein
LTLFERSYLTFFGSQTFGVALPVAQYAELLAQNSSGSTAAAAATGEQVGGSDTATEATSMYHDEPK